MSKLSKRTKFLFVIFAIVIVGVIALSAWSVLTGKLGTFAMGGTGYPSGPGSISGSVTCDSGSKCTVKAGKVYLVRELYNSNGVDTLHEVRTANITDDKAAPTSPYRGQYKFSNLPLTTRSNEYYKVSVERGCPPVDIAKMYGDCRHNENYEFHLTTATPSKTDVNFKLKPYLGTTVILTKVLVPKGTNPGLCSDYSSTQMKCPVKANLDIDTSLTTTDDNGMFKLMGIDSSISLIGDSYHVVATTLDGSKSGSADVTFKGCEKLEKEIILK